MRTYLANQALESGKPLAREFLGRSPSAVSQFGPGMMMNADANQPGKIGMPLSPRIFRLDIDKALSHPPLHLQIAQHWFLATCWAECDGPRRVLRPR